VEKMERPSLLLLWNQRRFLSFSGAAPKLSVRLRHNFLWNQSSSIPSYCWLHPTQCVGSVILAKVYHAVFNMSLRLYVWICTGKAIRSNLDVTCVEMSNNK
jgi:hypothetical protein